MKLESTNFRFKPEFKRRIKAAAEASGMSLTAWVVVACLEQAQMRPETPIGARKIDAPLIFALS
jgi:hypothetical protein